MPLTNRRASKSTGEHGNPKTPQHKCNLKSPHPIPAAGRHAHVYVSFCAPLRPKVIIKASTSTLNPMKPFLGPRPQRAPNAVPHKADELRPFARRQRRGLLLGRTRLYQWIHSETINALGFRVCRGLATLYSCIYYYLLPCAISLVLGVDLNSLQNYL